MNKPPETIYLIPDEVEGDRFIRWVSSEDPAPGPDMDEKDAVKYIRADKVEDFKNE